MIRGLARTGKPWLACFLAAVLAGGSGCAQGTEYWVDSARGDDANSGRGRNAAWRSLTPAGRISFSPGDSITVAAGSSVAVTETVGLDFSDGTEATPIVLRGEKDASGKRPILRGYDEDVLSFVSWTEGAVVESLEILGGERGLVFFDPSNIVIRDMIFRDSRDHAVEITGIGRNARVENCLFRRYHADGVNISRVGGVFVRSCVFMGGDDEGSRRRNMSDGVGFHRSPFEPGGVIDCVFMGNVGKSCVSFNDHPGSAGRVEHCVFVNNETTTILAKGAGTSLDVTYNVCVSREKIERTGRHELLVADGAKVRARHNTFLNRADDENATFFLVGETSELIAEYNVSSLTGPGALHFLGAPDGSTIRGDRNLYWHTTGDDERWRIHGVGDFPFRRDGEKNDWTDFGHEPNGAERDPELLLSSGSTLLEQLRRKTRAADASGPRAGFDGDPAEDGTPPSSRGEFRENALPDILRPARGPVGESK